MVPAGLGFWLTRAGLFPVPASRGASVLILNVFLPNLLFSKIVPSITPENAKAIGPIFLVGFVYIVISLVLGVLVRVTFRTPRNFRWGILAAATWSKCVCPLPRSSVTSHLATTRLTLMHSWGDLPTSVVQVRYRRTPDGLRADLTLSPDGLRLRAIRWRPGFEPCDRLRRQYVPPLFFSEYER